MRRHPCSASIGLLALAGVMIAPEAGGQALLRRFDGASGRLLGLAVRGIGDVDGNGGLDAIVSDGSAAIVVDLATGAELVRFDLALLQFNSCVNQAGDVDGDGRVDYVVGEAFGDSEHGVVYVYSGADGHEIRHVSGDLAGDRLGACVGALGDINGDGFGDIVASAPHEAPFGQPAEFGYVRAISGLDGSPIYTVPGHVKGDGFGYSMDLLGDMDGDGVPDWAAGAVFTTAGEYVQIVSGRTGSLIFELDGSVIRGFLAYSIGAAGDVSGDGIPDFAVGNPFDSRVLPNSGHAWLFSGLDGSLLREFAGEQLLGFLGADVRTAGDANGDGIPDLAIGNSPLIPGFTRGAVELHSGKTGALLYRFAAQPGDEAFGYSVAPAGDVDGDGAADLLIGAPGIGFGGTLYVMGGSDLHLEIESNAAFAGDLVTFTIREGVPGELNVLVLTEVGTTPSFQIIGGIGAFDGTGTRELQGTIPSGFFGLELTHTAFANGPAGNVIASELEVLSLQ